MADFFIAMEVKHFYFIKDNFFEDFQDPALMKNKEDGHGRPCFFAVKDSDGLFWMIPISSKVEKFRQIFNNKIARHKKCDTIYFANVLGQERAFLIQNMFPIVEEYIDDEYIQHPYNTPVMINELAAKELIEKFKKVLALVKNGNNGLVFPDVLAISTLLKQSDKSK